MFVYVYQNKQASNLTLMEYMNFCFNYETVCTNLKYTDWISLFVPVLLLAILMETLCIILVKTGGHSFVFAFAEFTKETQNQWINWIFLV